MERPTPYTSGTPQKRKKNMEMTKQGPGMWSMLDKYFRKLGWNLQRHGVMEI